MFSRQLTHSVGFTNIRNREYIAWVIIDLNLPNRVPNVRHSGSTIQCLQLNNDVVK